MTATEQATASDTQADLRATAARTLHDAKDKASDTVRKTAAAIDANPLAILVGGVAIGALAGALIPRSAREKELLAPLGSRIGDAARQAVSAAREAGKAELSNAGLTTDAARQRGKTLLDDVVKAISTAGSAAAEKARTSVKAASTDA